MARLSFLVSVLLVFALTATVIAGALYVGLLRTGAGATPSPSPRPSSVAIATPTPTPTPTPTETPSPSPTEQPTPGGTYVVQPGDFLSGIGDMFGVPWELIAQANNIEGPNYVITPGQELIIPLPQSACGDYDAYSVKSGDNIIDIATQLDVDWTDLADFNNIADVNSIHPGDVLCVPQPGWTPLPTT